MAAKSIPKKPLFVIMGGLLVISVLFLMGTAFFLMTPAEKEGNDCIVVIPRGATLRQVSDQLKNKGLITEKHAFLLYSRLMGYGRHIKAGEYRLNTGMSSLKVLQMLSQGRMLTHEVTLPEGFTVFQTATVLAEKGLVNRDRFLALTEDPEILHKYGLSGPSLEGFLYPDTYRFSRGLPPDLIIDTMVKRFQDIITPLRDRIERSGMSMEQVITLAAMVEKETGLAEERPLIASVFLNRLQKGMRLESDPTVIYGIEDFNGNLTRKDLKTPSPYNTYVIQGLPPWPIANPGREAIVSVLWPEKTEYLFFVSKNDGSHHFSKTLREHNQAVRRYQKTGPTRSGKTS
ncbi:MAG: endolytic transglycosylase MltG [Desulfatiglandaceae bacterium]